MSTRHFLAATLTTARAACDSRARNESSASSGVAVDETPEASRDSQIVAIEQVDPHRSGSDGNLPGGWLRLLAVGLCIAIVWLVVLPWMARFPVIREHIAAMEAGQIEVDAMFYTELNWKPPRSGSRGGVRLPSTP